MVDKASGLGEKDKEKELVDRSYGRVGIGGG
jgi:hypothetical protein